MAFPGKSFRPQSFLRDLRASVVKLLSPMRIQVLPQTLINQIAAGEVVVRMANVVKELVENSIDAGATRIEVLVSDDVRSVEVRDDGCGMGRDDAELSLQRHATSKIRTVEDLFHLQTRGFRGEAIPSIASVSRMEIQTRETDALSGTRIVIEGGRIQRIEAAGAPPGTRMIIRDLFFNTPARLKFLKSPMSEANALIGMLTRQALAQPAIAFRVERDGREVLELPANQTLEDRFAALLGSAKKLPLIPLNLTRDNVTISGYLAHPHDARSDRRSQFYFVNDRPFFSRQLSGALEQACRGYVMSSKFPMGCFFITIAPEEVDFNVHPTKEEVRFRDERFVAGALFHAAKEALEGSSALVGNVQLPDEEVSVAGASRSPLPSDMPVASPQPSNPFPAFFSNPDSLVRRAFDRKQQSQPDLLAPRAPSLPIAEPQRLLRTTPHHPDGSDIAAGPGERPDNSFWSQPYSPEPLGQVADTYIIVRYGPDLLMIDQHAVHERLVYLDLKRRQRGADSQPLLIPISLELTAAQGEIIRSMHANLAAIGIEVSEFGPRSWAVNSLPADLPEFDPAPMIMELLDDFEETKRNNAVDELRDRVLIRAACHSAIRAGAQLSVPVMEGLLQQIKAERLSFTCPHGRPTIIRLSKHELDRQFKRVH
ncbi:DNA mismatch repair endonuclease MutL [soil metagenome]